MTWILAIDARSGEQLALPVASTLVSFDMVTHKKYIEQQLMEGEQQVNTSQQVINMIGGGIPEAVVHQMMAGQNNATQQIANLRKRMGLIQAVLRCGDLVILAREIRYGRSWKEVVAFTRRPIVPDQPEEKKL